jgi:hypothetical protein
MLSALGSERSDHWDEGTPNSPQHNMGLWAIPLPMDKLIGRLFSLLAVPDMQAFIRVPDSDYPLPLGSWRPAAGSSPSQGLGSVQHGINMLNIG